uniref:Uncharacterized protein n=1 Tax=Vombatus ursinus TaxID=29139 RepID=A0A4X2JTA8_VOMUR
IQSLLSGFSGKLTWPSEEARCAQDLTGLASFQIKFEASVGSSSINSFLMVSCLLFLKKLLICLQVRFHFGVEVNGVLSKESFGGKNALRVAFPVFCVTRPGFLGAQKVCSRIHPVLGHPVALFIPDEEANMGLLGQLTLTPAAALCPCCKLHPDQTSQISAAFISF